VKKSHKWEKIERIKIRCPHCGKWSTRMGHFDEGDIFDCDHCTKDFKLGDITCKT
jgi:hypothetical protein